MNTAVLLRAFSLLIVILLGFLLKQAGLFKQSDFTVLSRIVLKVTLPCAVICNMNGADIDISMLGITVLGLLSGVILIACGVFLGRRDDSRRRAFKVLNVSGFNIGNFAMPFVQAVMGTAGLVGTSLFDVGNSVWCLGGAYSAAELIKYRDQQKSVGASAARIGKTMVKSVPFVCYVSMTALSLMHLALPESVISVVRIGANANPFLSMFMLGVAFQLGAVRDRAGEIFPLLGMRFAAAFAMSLSCYFLLPFSLEIRQALAVITLAPIGTAIPPFTAELKEDYGLSGTINSLSVLISIILIPAALLIFS